MPLAAQSDSPKWHERVATWRNRVLASPRFQHFVARFPLTRLVARRRGAAIFDLVAGFVYSQILAACIESRLLDRLAGGPLSDAAIAAAIDMPIASADRLLRAAAALALVERLDADRWMLASDGAALLGNRGIADMVAHHRLLYADLADPLDLLRRGGGGGALAGFWGYAASPGAGDPAAVDAYSRLMAASQPLVAQQIIDAYRFGRHRRLLDIGGGEGRFLESVGTVTPGLALGLFDLPAVGDRARIRLAAAGLADRATIHGGSFLADSLPAGYDLMTLVRVLHDHDDAPALALLRVAHAALPPGGRLLIAEPMAGRHAAGRAGDAYFGFYLLAMGSGRPRTPAEIRAMLHAAGFGESRIVRTAMPLTCSIIVAKR